MNINEYQKLAARTLIDGEGVTYTPQETMLQWTALGLAGEAGEVVDLIKKQVCHQHGIDADAIAKELGDVLWYIAAIASVLGLSLDEVADRNIEKLRKRYPSGFDYEASRDRVE